jgi:hypothetical protein
MCGVGLESVIFNIKSSVTRSENHSRTKFSCFRCACITTGYRLLDKTRRKEIEKGVIPAKPKPHSELIAHGTTGKVKVRIANETYPSTLPWKINHALNSYFFVTFAYKWPQVTTLY